MGKSVLANAENTIQSYFLATEENALRKKVLENYISWYFVSIQLHYALGAYNDLLITSRLPIIKTHITLYTASADGCIDLLTEREHRHQIGSHA